MPAISTKRRWKGIGVYNFSPHPCIFDIQNNTFKVSAYEACIQKPVVLSCIPFILGALFVGF